MGIFTWVSLGYVYKTNLYYRQNECTFYKQRLGTYSLSLFVVNGQWKWRQNLIQRNKGKWSQSINLHSRRSNCASRQYANFIFWFWHPSMWIYFRKILPVSILLPSQQIIRQRILVCGSFLWVFIFNGYLFLICRTFESFSMCSRRTIEQEDRQRNIYRLGFYLWLSLLVQFLRRQYLFITGSFHWWIF